MNWSLIITILVLIPIILFSIVSLAIIFDRFVLLNKNRMNPDILTPYLNGDMTGLISSLKNDQKITLFNQMLLNLLQRKYSSQKELEELIDSRIASLHLQYQARISLLGIFSRLSTLTGFLGTVIGMILAFNNIVQNGISTANIVAGGISSALITTAAGIISAIPSSFFHDYFQNRIETEFQQIQIVLSELLSVLFRKRQVKNEN